MKRCSSTATGTPATARKLKARPLIGRYTDAFPCELARVQSGRLVNLRDYETQVKLKRFSYDLKLQDGKVIPAEGNTFIGPNGCSLREPFSPTFQEVVRNFRGVNILIYIIPEGTPIPQTLTLLHEHSDHFSLQCTKPLTLPELNNEITEFLEKHAHTITKEEFDVEYPFEI
ncbi:hypothetical protein CROQUDRAFT_36532 [Cronartium quercuum f. sp. fusiforme G11]|uniref:Tse2 ADP-ribosyltransferase toxin domain-containing protein n=1 Tax=Cronartium quercuum f. sp. fusiforme G11 TaxID=708437 RepID=A0A9P6TIB6_9BASI|nr:hypothetical protein CROQUDRAFT_36532 [Cronartium quercuum f. sp. fusiforme G11]